jgi:nucleoside-diphosphate-sugar epimerase
MEGLEVKILITGNMGYVGPSVVGWLRSTYPDFELIGLDLGFFAHCLTGAATFPETQLDRQIFTDVRTVTAESIFEKIGEIYAVVHLAAISNDPMGNAFEQVTREINFQSSVQLAQISKEIGVKRFVFASSCSVYGLTQEGPRKEGHELNPLSVYARSKIDAEKGLADLADDSFVVTCLRFATACGMSQRVRLDLVVNDFVASAVVSNKIVILSDGTPWRPFIHVKDMARAIDWGISRDVQTGGSFLAINAGSDEWNYQVKDLAECIAQAIPGAQVYTNKDAPPDKRSYQVDFSKFRELAPRHQPQVSLSDAIRGLKEGLELIKFNDIDFRNSSLIRLKVLKDLVRMNQLNKNLEWVRD